MERLVLYHTNTGNSAYLARRAAKALHCEARPVEPAFGHVLPLYLLSLLGLPLRTGVSRGDVARYDEIVLFGPIWGGLLIAPLRTVLRLARRAGVPVHLGITGETSEEDSDGRFGFDRVLRKADRVAGPSLRSTGVFSTALVRPPGAEASLKTSEKTRLTDANFQGPIRDRFDHFLDGIGLTGISGSG